MIIWLIIFVVFLVAEMVTAGAMVSLWFCIGALAALGMNVLGYSVLWQIVTFVVISLVSLFLFKMFAGKRSAKPAQSFTASKAVGQKGIVTEAIDNTTSQGQVKVDGALWSARSEDGQPIEENTVVIVRRLDGIKAIVKRKEQ